ncbi:MAG: acyl-CoA dehydratase activase [Spirochaetes bacterium]|jgi:predicted CoA-substrate-specific enzyme activase|nr:acyl-CoA dehydratase activase [Spirochaetota bacterium]
MSKKYFIGMDLGSTTAKIVVGYPDESGISIEHSAYKRHHAKIRETIVGILKDVREKIGNAECLVSITGSAGMGISETTGLRFVQEVVASATYIKRMQPDIRTFIEIGGEDSKIIFFDEDFHADMRMNGSCAGGTGSFIDQISVLLDIPVEEFDEYASRGDKVFPVATRCGVFAKTDVQSLLSHNVSKENIALSAFHAVALQVLSTLTRGHDIEPKILLGGGPLTFNKYLRKAFVNCIKDFPESDFVVTDNPQLIPAIGTALTCDDQNEVQMLDDLITLVEKVPVFANSAESLIGAIPELFKDDDDYKTWLATFDKYRVNRIDFDKHSEKDCFLGIDSGSTTTKIVLADDEGNLVSTFYQNNMGDPIGTVQKGLKQISDFCSSKGFTPQIVGSGVTGYGEGLIKCAFGLDHGFVETMAHFRAASHFDPDVSFILDIGGQDMKAMFIRDGYVADIQINEACSSGCGSFIETFANNMGYPVANFAEIACRSKKPYDLGTRCTVFMNTKVKQALREGASIEDISAGLSFSVIKNTLYKVLKLTDSKPLGENIVLQGGTFKNNSILRAFEQLTGREIIRPDIPELMGAFGCALKAMDLYKENRSDTVFPGVAAALTDVETEKKIINCKGCENKCQVTKLTFPNGNHFYIGNNCERIFTNNTEVVERGENLVSEKRDIIFRRNLSARKPRGIRIGIPRILNMFENFPFWATFFNDCGIDVVLSDRSNVEIFEAGVKSVMSENICFPAKIAHGHILNLVEKDVDRIFFPNVVFERDEYEGSQNTYNCPVVTGYPCVIRSSIDPESRFNIPLDSPPISFRSSRLIVRQLIKYMKTLNVREGLVRRAYKAAIHEQKATKKRLQDRARDLIAKADSTGKPLLVMAGRPYHIDKLINHGIPELISDLGAIVIPEDSIPGLNSIIISDVNVLSQWAYTNRLYATAKWVSEHPTAQLIQINSFGCGPDAVSADEVKEILEENDKLFTIIKVDEVFNLGAVKIRIRSMLEALKKKKTVLNRPEYARRNIKTDVPFSKEKTIIVPHFSKYYSPIIPPLFKSFGLKMETLPVQDNDSVDYGIKNINNEICYPAILVAGDIIKAYQQNNYSVDDSLVLLTQTGGQCRASNYINLVNKALDKVGFGDVQVATLSTSSLKTVVTGREGILLAKKMVLGILLLDQLMYMYLTTKPRELEKGSANKLHEKYINLFNEVIVTKKYEEAFAVLDEAVKEFNAIKVSSEPIPRIGFVGEIFVKYNEFAHMNLIEWVLEQGAEIVLPPLQGFFLHDFISRDYMHDMHIAGSIMSRMINRFIWNYVNRKVKKVDRIMEGYRYYKKPHDLHVLANKTENFVSLVNQFGEGWLLTADMLSMLDEGVENIISVQPFGCISNHVVAKGVEKRIKNLYPGFKLLAIDFDQSTSPANVFNRAHFMVASAKETLAKELERAESQGE